MAHENFAQSLSFVWEPGFDDPADGYHVTPGDSGGGTFGGVIENTWAGARARGLVTGDLRNASREQLATVLKDEFWGAACETLPAGLDLALFNGRMMSGGYPRLFQRCLGLMGEDVDGDIGGETLGAARGRDVATLLKALAGVHYAYVARLPSWPRFKGGWTKRLQAACDAALRLAAAPVG